MWMVWFGAAVLGLVAMRQVALRWHAARLLKQGLDLLAQKRFDEALQRLDRLLARRPTHAAALYQRGIALLSLKRYPESIDSFERVLSQIPHHADALYRKGNAFLRLDRPADALVHYDLALACEGDPAFADVHYNRGLALQALKRPADALASYDRTLALQPDDAEALNNRGNALLELRRPLEALESYQRALARQPQLVDARFNTGVALHDLKRPHDAALAYEQVLQLQPDYPGAIGRLLHTRMLCCDWRDFDALCASVDAGVRRRVQAAEPFGYLASARSSSDLRLAAESYAQAYRMTGVPPLWSGERYRHDKIRLGYLSGDFRHQATSILMVEMFELHDRSRFELFAFDAGWSDGSAIRRRIKAAFDEIVDISGLGDEEAALAMRQREIDIVVDLNGYFGLARPGILPRRPCPVQVNYLGYPGTLGADHMDYILADACVIPPSDQPHFAERVVLLPDCYQANDSTRRVPEPAGSRAQAGLADGAFVFCCFNNSFKITPSVFAVWMNLLRRVEGSLLWLLEDNPMASINLRKEAKRRGVAAERLVFAPRQPLPLHLARHALADLFLDTLPCNAHTTASDALWAGLPLLTCRGETFPGRVAASVLGAAGLPELVTHSLEDYEALAVDLATSPGRLQALKDRLARQRSSCTLFDTARLTRHVEAAYAEMWARCRRGESPAAIVVQDPGGDGGRNIN